MTLTVTVLTLFPDSLSSMLEASILGRAQKAGALVVERVDLRDFSPNKHRTVDDTPCGGGPGMILRVDVVAPAIRAACVADDARGTGRSRRVLLFEPRGRPFTQDKARALSTLDHLVLVCGRYEGVDARTEAYVDEMVSIGDYVLTGGELPALVVLDAVTRLLPGVLGNAASAEEESHGAGLLEHRQYTRPICFEGRCVPPVLLGGNHHDIARARRKDALVLTERARPDLAARCARSRDDEKVLADDKVPLLDWAPDTALEER